jgi:hypothetical protein
MPAEELSFRVASAGPLTDFTAKNPRAVLSLWCDWKREVIEIVGVPEDEVVALKERLSEKSSFVEHFALANDTHVLMMDCLGLPHDIVNEAADVSHCISVPPTRFEAGWEHYRVVSFHEARSRELFGAIREKGGDVELLSKRKLDVQPLLNTRGLAVPALLDGLTDKQVEALILAARHGMYRSPRLTTAASIADAVGLSRSTFEEHLRKAENRLLTSLIPYLELAHRARVASQPAPAS